MACRLWLGGGGALMGVLVIISSAGLGLFCHFRWRPQLEPPSTWMLYMFGIAVHLVMVGLIFTLPYDTALSVLKNIGLPVMLLYPLATILIGKILSDQEASFRFMEKLQASEEKYKELVENANSIILRWDTFGKITFMNEYALNFFGYSHNEIIGQKLLGTIVPQSDSAGKDLSQMVLDIATHPERYKNNENENMRKDGTRVYVVWTNKPIMDDHGQCIGILCVGNDITERKQAEAEREKLENQLHQSQKMEAVGQLAGGVAHDFNNMLSVINGYSDMMLVEMSTADPNYERIKEIHKAGLRSSELTQQLLAFARKQTIAPKVIDWNDAVVGMLKMLQRLIGENIELVLKPAATPLQVKMDPSQVNQILANLIVNARDAISLAGEYKGDIHLLMTDVIMPEMSGRDLMDRISSMRCNIKCLYMSGYTADVIAHKGVLDEGIHFLEKPFTAEALSVKLREALS